MTQRLIPGVGYVDETDSAQRLIPGVGYVDETVSGAGSNIGLYVANASHVHTADTPTLTPSTLDLVIANASHSQTTEATITVVLDILDDDAYPGAIFGFLPTLGGEIILPPATAPVLTLTPNSGAGTVTVGWNTPITAYMTHDVEIRLPL